MFNISDLINSIEKLTFQLISWIILIPKTLFWILAAPASMVKYIDHQLEQKNPEFQSFISPIFLFLLVGLGPIALESFIKLPEIHIDGKRNVMVDSTYQYTAKIDYLSDWTEYRTNKHIYEYVWSHGKNRSDKKLIKTYLFENFLPEENILDITFAREFYNENEVDSLPTTTTLSNKTNSESITISRDSTHLFLDIYAYKLADYTDFDEEKSTTYSGGNTLPDRYQYVAGNKDTLPFQVSIPINVFDSQLKLKNVERITSKDAEDSTTGTIAIDEKQLYAIGIALMSLPLFFAVSLIIKEDEKINLTNLKRRLYAQCALFTPIVLIFQFGILYENIVPPQYTGNVIFVILILGLASIVWFTIVQANIYLLSIKEVIAILFGLPFLITISIMLFIEALIEFSHFKWIVWLFVIAISIPLVMSLGLSDKNFIEEEEA
ncbi:hypothetical protein R9C00_17165 [Flammeovirgaceae bacterium SG7u.111]|nr:hypothetical protein [Flammeovirgaceae bacterium SG7u.132]WPO33432.1 hypothetical protein R9C00_17165 [Flammeovirgaceae bacterium SG7u.111]